MKRGVFRIGSALRPALVVALLAALAAPAPGAAAADPARPDAITQPLKDGCQRNPAGLLTFSSPEWVYVYGADAGLDHTRLAEGIAHATSPAGEDLPQNHAYYDIDSNIALDPQYGYLLGGDPAAQNGNFGPGGEDTGRLHVEWETGTVPPQFWPSEGDRVKIWGPWIWDCGHWGQGLSDPDYFLPGNQPGLTANGLRGEQTEIHPMHALVVTRAIGHQSPFAERETDAFISSDGNKSHGEEQCTKEHPAPQGPNGFPLALPYGPDWTACVLTTTHQIVNDRDYSFFVPAPPKPPGATTVRYRVQQVAASKGAPVDGVQVKAGGIQVTVHFNDASKTDAMQYGKSFFVGWEGDSLTPATHLLVDFKSITVDKSFDPNPNGSPQTGVPPGEWVVYIDANGFWQLLNDWQPRLLAVNDGDVLPINRTADLFVPAGKPLRLLVNPRECDLPQIAPCANTSEVSSGNDHPGDSLDYFPTARAALGSHTARPAGPDGANYHLDYTVRRGPSVSPGAAGAVAGPCYDIRAPRARTSRARVHVTHRRISARGTATDIGCGRPRGRVRRIEIAVAERVGGGCRFLGARGRLGRRVSCYHRTFLRARGTGRWRFSKRARLPRGHYVLIARGTDRAGNVQHLQTPVSRIPFFVR
ncbi:MAG TPA: hypothetical protein VIM22_04075 [Solirubrobacteraceae bacterium]